MDLGLDGVAAALEQRNILVIRAKAPLALADLEWRSLLLSDRLAVTASPGDLEHDASSFDIGIISLRRLDEIDPDPSVKNRTAALISRAIIDLGLWSVRHGFLLELDPSGAKERHLFTPLVDQTWSPWPRSIPSGGVAPALRCSQRQQGCSAPVLGAPGLPGASRPMRPCLITQQRVSV